MRGDRCGKKRSFGHEPQTGVEKCSSPFQDTPLSKTLLSAPTNFALSRRGETAL